MGNFSSEEIFSHALVRHYRGVDMVIRKGSFVDCLATLENTIATKGRNIEEYSILSKHQLNTKEVKNANNS